MHRIDTREHLLLCIDRRRDSIKHGRYLQQPTRQAEGGKYLSFASFSYWSGSALTGHRGEIEIELHVAFGLAEVIAFGASSFLKGLGAGSSQARRLFVSESPKRPTPGSPPVYISPKRGSPRAHRPRSSCPGAVWELEMGPGVVGHGDVLATKMGLPWPPRSSASALWCRMARSLLLGATSSRE
jgi:hypothetical protein